MGLCVGSGVVEAGVQDGHRRADEARRGALVAARRRVVGGAEARGVRPRSSPRTRLSGESGDPTGVRPVVRGTRLFLPVQLRRCRTGTVAQIDPRARSRGTAASGPAAHLRQVGSRRSRLDEGAGVGSSGHARDRGGLGGQPRRPASCAGKKRAFEQGWPRERQGGFRQTLDESLETRTRPDRGKRWRDPGETASSGA